MNGLARSAVSWLAGLLLVAAISAGLAWHECMLLAIAAVVGQRLFLWQMDLAAPMEGWRAGVRCLFAGLTGLVATAGLIVVVATGLSGVWSSAHEHATLSLGVIVAAGVLLTVAQRGAGRRLSESLLWMSLVAIVAAGFAGFHAGYVAVPCLAVAAVTAWLAWQSWRLTRTSASELFRSSQR